MISDARRGHVSPGIYTEEKDILYSVKSLGITSLGLVGETLYGPAFQNVEISNWGEFVDYFGGTSSEKFKNGYPKYELPYVAKEYLTESNRLNVVRVLGLSGYNAGKPWVLWNENKPVLVLRSKMIYGVSKNICEAADDMPENIVSSLTIGTYEQARFGANCKGIEGEGSGVPAPNKFKITVECIPTSDYASPLTYNVSLNPSDSDYIYNVIGNRPDAGTAPIYVEALYESHIGSSGITIKDDLNVTGDTEITSTTSGNTLTTPSSTTIELKEYYKVKELISENKACIVEKCLSSNTAIDISKFDDYSIKCNVLSGGSIDLSKSGISVDTVIFETIKKVVYDFCDFKEQYRAAQTPWIVSDAVIKVTKGETGEKGDKGDKGDQGEKGETGPQGPQGETSEKTVELRKLFRFITISDGDAANFQVKVSIQNIDVTNGNFDVVVRDFNDTDANPVVLETFRKCNLVEGDSNYIAFKIGSSDGGYESKSKYILVKMAEGEDFAGAIPAGFLGYPMPKYGQTGASFNMLYNTVFYPSVKAKKQYFGISNLASIDRDVFTYKGKDFYNDEPDMLTTGFHMDSAISGANSDKILVDNVSGYSFTCVNGKINSSKEQYAPRLINASYINQTLYGDINTRKFTVCFCGGFDGWDVNRGERSNTDEFKATQYNVNGSMVFKEYNMDNDLNLPLDIPATAITSDYYAYLAGCRVFANPQDIDINLFATPGINWLDHNLLTEEIIDVIEDGEDGRNGDALYIMAAPGADSKIVTAQDAVEAFNEAEINSSYACTYFPWVMYYDSSNKRYINLPVTKDVVKNMASIDNNSFPWFAPAGSERGKVNCIKAAYKTRLSDEDMLYEAGINPVKSFAQDGVMIWGNKTAYPVETPTNRINVRRMMIRVKKLIIDAAKHLIFEQYDEELEKQFRNIVEPILADVKANRGIADYRVITECTPETRDQHILPAKILVKPVNSLEYISISFNVYPESVDFKE